MRFLADESCDFAIVRALRAAGHDVTAVAEITPRAEDPAVAELAVSENRLLLTEDKDFGRLVFGQRLPSAGVILIRCPVPARAQLASAIVELVRERGDSLDECFVVVGPRRIRISRIPRGGSDAEDTDSDEDARRSEWHRLQRNLAGCQECRERWPGKVSLPLRFGEIPDPPPQVDVLFVGVAPTKLTGQSSGGHFYSDSRDRLRLGLFKLLNEPEFGVPLAEVGLEEGNRAFHSVKCFFVHAAKIRPLDADAPPVEAIAYCALRHLVNEVAVLNPRAVCFLGKNNLGQVTEAMFGRRLGPAPELVSRGSWRGVAAVAKQPRRNWVDDARTALRELWRDRRPKSGPA